MFLLDIGEALWVGLEAPNEPSCDNAACDGLVNWAGSKGDFVYPTWLNQMGTSVTFNDPGRCVRATLAST